MTQISRCGSHRRPPSPTRPSASTAANATTAVDPVDQAIFNEEVRQFVKDKAAITAAMKALYSVARGQCSEALRSKLKSNPDYNAFSAAVDSLQLPQAIRSEMTGFKRLHYLAHSVHSILREFYSLTQGKHRTNRDLKSSALAESVNTTHFWYLRVSFSHNKISSKESNDSGTRERQQF
jgi:hypothetical protein